MTNSADPDQLASSADLDLHCLQKQDISGFSRFRVNKIMYKAENCYVGNVVKTGKKNYKAVSFFSLFSQEYILYMPGNSLTNR